MSYTQAFFFWTGFALTSVASFIVAMCTSLDLKMILVTGVMIICAVVTALIQAPFALREQKKKD